MNSILNSTKKFLGISSEYTQFDADIIMHINSVLMILNQIGVGKNIIIKDDTTVWDEFEPDIDEKPLVKSYVYMKVRTMFDPPTSGQVSESLQRAIAEAEWRLSISNDN